MIIMIEVFPVAPISMIRNMAEVQKVKKKQYNEHITVVSLSAVW